MFDEIFDDKSQQSVQSAQSSALLQEHAQTLQSHEERLNVAIERIQHIWDTLNTGELTIFITLMLVLMLSLKLFSYLLFLFIPTVISEYEPVSCHNQQNHND